MRRRNKRKRSPLSYILCVTACVIFSALLISKPQAEKFSAPVPAEAAVSTAPTEADAETAVETPAPAYGALLESGSGINENYYKRLDYSGTASELSASSFVLGRERPATVCKTGQDHPAELTVHFGPETQVKTAFLYYAEDRFEIYMASLSDLEIAPGYFFDVRLEDPAAPELWAKEIILATYVF